MTTFTRGLIVGLATGFGLSFVFVVWFWGALT